jgi:hypothetical protein
MAKTVVIHQPDFMPYIGFFERLLHCQLFVVLDHVQYIKGGWQNRDKIKTPEGVKWLTIPLQIKGNTFSPYNRVIMSKNEDWRTQHLNILKRCYKGTAHFCEIYDLLETAYSVPCELMIDFNLNLLKVLMELFDLHPQLVLSSEINPEGKRNEMLVDILKKVSADIYLSGVGAKDYLDEKLFSDADVAVKWQNFSHPVYPQLHGDFTSYLSSIDLLFNCGIERSREILRGR